MVHEADRAAEVVQVEDQVQEADLATEVVLDMGVIHTAVQDPVKLDDPVHRVTGSIHFYVEIHC